jgi:hypothetical protein
MIFNKLDDICDWEEGKHPEECVLKTCKRAHDENVPEEEK